MNNPYSTPGASIDVDPRVATYQPRFLALNGRIGRVRYFAYTVGLSMLMYAVLIPLLFLTGLSGSMNSDAASAGAINPVMAGIGGLLLIVLYIAVLVMAMGYVVRRLNDLGRTGWMALLFLVPLANFVLWIYLQFVPGQKGPNQYGPAPVANSGGVIALAIIGAVLMAVVTIGVISAISLPAYQDYLQRAEKMQQMQQQ